MTDTHGTEDRGLERVVADHLARRAAAARPRHDLARVLDESATDAAFSRGRGRDTARDDGAVRAVPDEPGVARHGWRVAAIAAGVLALAGAVALAGRSGEDDVTMGSSGVPDTAGTAPSSSSTTTSNTTTAPAPSPSSSPRRRTSPRAASR